MLAVFPISMENSCLNHRQTEVFQNKTVHSTDIQFHGREDFNYNEILQTTKKDKKSSINFYFLSAIFAVVGLLLSGYDHCQ